MAGEQIIQSGLIVGRVAGPTVTIVPTTDGLSTFAFDDRSGGQTSEITFNHATNSYAITVGTVTQMLITSTDVTVDGDLVVNGTTTTVNATNLEVTDKVILVNKDETLTGVGNGTGVAGIEVKRGTLANTDWLFNETNDWWGTSGAIQTIGNIAAIDSTLASEQVLTVVSTGAIMPPSGTTAQRPATPSAGMIRYNTDLPAFEIYRAAWDEPVFQNTSSFTVLSTDAGATSGPQIIFDRDSASPLANDFLGIIRFRGNDSGIATQEYGAIYSQIVTTTAAAEDGRLVLRTTRGGANNNVLTLDDGLQIGAPTGGDKGVGTVNATKYYENGASFSAASVGAVAKAGDSMYGNLDIGDGSDVDLSFTGVSAGGSSYVAGDVLTVSGGTFTTAAQLRVLTIDGGGAVLTFELATNGVYTVAPGSPASTTGGSGTSATFTLTSAASNVNILPDVDYSGAVIPKDIGQTDGVDGKSGNLRFRAMHAETFHGVATEAQYADLAERYAADATYEPGTVVIFGGEAEITLTNTKEDTRVAGVVSTDPAFRMNCMVGTDDTHPYIALKGKVPCKVTGAVRKGELLVTSSRPGYAESVENNAKPYTAFARANENFSGDDGVIQVSII